MKHSLKKLCGAGALLLPLSVWAQDNGSLYNGANTQSKSASGNLALFNQLQDQQGTINDLRGQIEDLQHQVQQMQDQGTKRYEDLDTRLSALEGNGGDGQQGSGADANADGGQQAGAAAADNESNDQSSDDSQAYNKAFGLIQDKKYDDAVTALKQFNQKYPKSPLKANSYYWLGQLYNNQSKREGASKAFSAVLSEFPDSSKAPDAAYALAMIKARQGDDEGAQKLLNGLVKNHADTDAGKKAAAFLKKVNG